jgi:hypothetical protein
MMNGRLKLDEKMREKKNVADLFRSKSLQNASDSGPVRCCLYRKHTLYRSAYNNIIFPRNVLELISLQGHHVYRTYFVMSVHAQPDIDIFHILD